MKDKIKTSLVATVSAIIIFGGTAKGILAFQADQKEKVELRAAVKRLERFVPKPIYRVTAYCACSKCCGKWADGFTASGHKIQQGDKFCAADKSIPVGTMITIPGYGRVSVLDRGGVIRGNRLDVFFDTHQEALNWGVKFLEIEK